MTPRGRAVGGALVCLAVLAVCLCILRQLAASGVVGELDLSLSDGALFYALLVAIQLLSLSLWRLYAAGHGIRRSFVEALVDSGLLALGKYLPGKIWGLMARGTIGEDGVKVETRRVLVSVSEQLTLAVTGILLFLVLIAASRWSMSVAATVSTGTSALVAAGIALALVRRRFDRAGTGGVSTRSSLGGCLLLTGGYGVLWLVSTLPIVVLVHQSGHIGLGSMSALMTAFLGAMLAGWLALFAPGGIGVRESVFVLLAPPFLSWEEGLFWITAHRGLSLIFDLVYGLICLAFVAQRSRPAVTT